MGQPKFIVNCPREIETSKSGVPEKDIDLTTLLHFVPTLHKHRARHVKVSQEFGREETQRKPFPVVCFHIFSETIVHHTRQTSFVIQLSLPRELINFDCFSMFITNKPRPTPKQSTDIIT